MAKHFWLFIAIGLVIINLVYGQQHHFFNETEELFLLEAHEHATSFLEEGNGNPLLVGFTLIHNAAAKGAGTILVLVLPTNNTAPFSSFPL